jgi:hypothetical protein
MMVRYTWEEVEAEVGLRDLAPEMKLVKYKLQPVQELQYQYLLGLALKEKVRSAVVAMLPKP